jgi:hypothetical protein
MFGVAFASAGSSPSPYNTAGVSGLPVGCTSILALLVGGSAIVFLGAMFSFLGAYPAADSTSLVVPVPTPRQVSIMGNTAILVLILFYSSPLSALATVLRTRNSAPFQVRLNFQLIPLIHVHIIVESINYLFN